MDLECWRFFAPIVILCSFVLIQKNQKIKAALICVSAANGASHGDRSCLVLIPPIVVLCSFVLIQKNQKIKAALNCVSAANDTSRGADKALGDF